MWIALLFRLGSSSRLGHLLLGTPPLGLWKCAVAQPLSSEPLTQLVLDMAVVAEELVAAVGLMVTETPEAEPLGPLVLMPPREAPLVPGVPVPMARVARRVDLADWAVVLVVELLGLPVVSLMVQHG